jgi:ribonuclease HI
MAAGAVLRNHKGEAIVVGCLPLYHMISVATTKAIALVRGLEFMEKLGCTSATVESDSLELI